MDRRQIGKYFEDKAMIHLRANGVEILQRNYHAHHSEIDAIAFDPQNQTLLFVEIRARANASIAFGSLASSLHSPRKRKALIRGARSFLQEVYSGSRKVPYFTGIRFDLILFVAGDLEVIPNFVSV